MTASTPKKILYGFCRTFIENRIIRIQDNLRGVRESMTSETKSSAGDKHETGRAMLQLECEKLGQQLAEAEKMKQVMCKVPLEGSSSIVLLGSLVRTSKADYYLAISAGQFKQGDASIFCISMGTPVGRLLRGKSVNDVVILNGNQTKILSVE